METKNLSNIKHGLIVTEMIDDELHILHFCGYWDYPNEDDIIDLRRELKEDKFFGLTEKDNLEITIAPLEIVNYFKNSKTDGKR